MDGVIVIVSRSVLNVNQTVVEPAFIEKFELHVCSVVE